MKQHISSYLTYVVGAAKPVLIPAGDNLAKIKLSMILICERCHYDLGQSLLPEDPENAILKKLNPNQPAAPETPPAADAPAADAPATGDDADAPAPDDSETDAPPADNAPATPAPAAPAN